MYKQKDVYKQKCHVGIGVRGLTVFKAINMDKLEKKSSRERKSDVSSSIR